VAARQRITETGVGPLSEQPEPRGASDPQWANKTEELGRTRPAQSKKHPRLRSRSNTLRCPASRFRPTRFLDRVYPRHRSMDHLFPRMQTRLVAVTHCRLMCHLIEDRATRLPGGGSADEDRGPLHEAHHDETRLLFDKVLEGTASRGSTMHAHRVMLA
jgi:hypothetical protein